MSNENTDHSNDTLDEESNKELNNDTSADNNTVGEEEATTEGDGGESAPLAALEARVGVIIINFLLIWMLFVCLFDFFCFLGKKKLQIFEKHKHTNLLL